MLRSPSIQFYRTGLTFFALEHQWSVKWATVSIFSRNFPFSLLKLFDLELEIGQGVSKRYSKLGEHCQSSKKLYLLSPSLCSTKTKKKITFPPDSLPFFLVCSKSFAVSRWRGGREMLKVCFNCNALQPWPGSLLTAWPRFDTRNRKKYSAYCFFPYNFFMCTFVKTRKLSVATKANILKFVSHNREDYKINKFVKKLWALKK